MYCIRSGKYNLVTKASIVPDTKRMPLALRSDIKMDFRIK